MKKTTLVFLLLVVISTMLIAGCTDGSNICSNTYTSAGGNRSTNIRPKPTGSRDLPDSQRYGYPDCCSSGYPDC